VNARAGLDHEQSEKENLLVQTREDEATFQQLVEERQSTQSSINSEISRLEQRRRAANDGDGTDPLAGDVGAWVWPVSGRTITTYFDDAGYVFRRYFRHLALDIDGSQGDPIYAMNDGVVASTHFSGLSFAFVIIQHADGFSSLYGHTSSIYVSVGDEVKKGDVIAAVGGIPGTPGAGGLTTGDHLHVALYLNGTPVDPLNYLP
jgi:murein DD-endopeptidase MepM/ murein hydrolase activator NlpD